MAKTKTKKRRIRYDRIFLFLGILIVLVLCFWSLLGIRISNIYILNNSYLKDQNIIEMAQISDYPSTLKNPSFILAKRLNENAMIKKAKVYKKGLTKVYIEVEENMPIFYYEPNRSTVLSDGQEVNIKYSVPTVVNYITDTYYDKFVSEMSRLDRNVLNIISEIKFYPNDVDTNRFLFTMDDGNYVYVNLLTFEKMNKYLSIKEGLPNDNGILYLDYGNNFEILK